MMLQKVDAAQALASRVRDGDVIAVGGFGLSGAPFDLIDALRDTGARHLTIISNNMGIAGCGLGILLDGRQVDRVICSYAGENAVFAEQFLNGDVAVEFVPQGTLAERLRAGGAGIAGFYTRTGVGTQVAANKETREFDGVAHVLELGLKADLGLVHAHTADGAGNLIYRAAARNFNPLVAAASRFTIAEAEHIVDTGTLGAEVVVTPGVFVNAIVQSSNRDKPIEVRTVRARALV